MSRKGGIISVKEGGIISVKEGGHNQYQGRGAYSVFIKAKGRGAIKQLE